METLAAARRALAADLADLTPQQWATPSLCGGWTVEQTLAHLTAAAVTTLPRWLLGVAAAGGRPAVHDQRRLTEQLGPDPAGTLARFAAVDPARTGPSKHTAAWLGEVLVHGQDVRRPLGLPGTPPVAAWTTVAGFYAARDFAVPSRTVARGLRLEAVDGPFATGAGPLVRGRTEALVMVLAGRRAHLEEVDGEGIAVLAGRIRAGAGPYAVPAGRAGRVVEGGGLENR
ncbi:maleylpyruvate isomerase family mycothiol-dependent enzyme [Kineococcus sp. SYSU DK001]|uniref:maleylpyruvate isomerase family mycothiol-dependent enzyme n=1 Tax=Kineococcus sp. SYSU DK001 TaxID=3383122 RepID=UPI003D7EF973